MECVATRMQPVNEVERGETGRGVPAWAARELEKIVQSKWNREVLGVDGDMAVLVRDNEGKVSSVAVRSLVGRTDDLSIWSGESWEKLKGVERLEDEKLSKCIYTRGSFLRAPLGTRVFSADHPPVFMNDVRCDTRLRPAFYPLYEDSVPRLPESFVGLTRPQMNLLLYQHGLGGVATKLALKSTKAAEIRKVREAPRFAPDQQIRVVSDPEHSMDAWLFGLWVGGAACMPSPQHPNRMWCIASPRIQALERALLTLNTTYPGYLFKIVDLVDYMDEYNEECPKEATEEEWLASPVGGACALPEESDDSSDSFDSFDSSGSSEEIPQRPSGVPPFGQRPRKRRHEETSNEKQRRATRRKSRRKLQAGDMFVLIVHRQQRWRFTRGWTKALYDTEDRAEWKRVVPPRILNGPIGVRRYFLDGLRLNLKRSSWLRVEGAPLANAIALLYSSIGQNIRVVTTENPTRKDRFLMSCIQGAPKREPYIVRKALLENTTLNGVYHIETTSGRIMTGVGTTVVCLVKQT